MVSMSSIAFSHTFFIFAAFGRRVVYCMGDQACLAGLGGWGFPQDYYFGS